MKELETTDDAILLVFFEYVTCCFGVSLVSVFAGSLCCAQVEEAVF